MSLLRAPGHLLALLALTLAGTLPAATVSFTGNFSQDDNIRFFQFNLDSSSTVMLSTYSYGGGMLANGTMVPAGGFQPVLSLFSGVGTFLAGSGPNGTCPPQNADPSTGLCVDATIQQSNLSSGTYFVALTQFFNVANTPNLAAGFLQQGTGNFTGPTCGVAGGSFLDETCTQRNSNYALQFTGVTSAQQLAGQPEPIPEPGTVLLVAGPLAFYALVRRRRASRAQSAVRF